MLERQLEQGLSHERHVELAALTMPAMRVSLDVRLSAFANARSFYTHTKQAAAKTSKTLEAAEVAIKQAEKKAATSVQAMQTMHAIRAIRRNYWFEKFWWFVSSENYVVVGGKDAMQKMTDEVFKHSGVGGSRVLADPKSRSFQLRKGGTR